MLAMLTSFAAQTAEGGSFWLPPAMSTTAEFVDPAWNLVLWITTAAFVIVAGATAYFAFAYRQKGADDKTHPISHSNALEIFWSSVSAVLLFALFFIGLRGYMNLTVPPGDAMEIRATGQKWYWTFDYPAEGISVSASPDLVKMTEDKDTVSMVVPVGKAVKIIGSSVDVIHSFYIPAARIKKDVLPNRYSVTWFEPTQTGTFDIFCTEYCGADHSRMIAKLVVKTQEEYDAWVDHMKNNREISPELVWAKGGCSACHSVDGSAGIGPTLAGKYGAAEVLADGTSVTIDDNYIRESIVNPTAKIVKGYGPVMPTFAGRLDDREIDALVDYIKSLK